MSRAARLEGKVAIITGGASGMGKASVARFLDEGATVVAAALQEDALAALEIPEDRGYGSVTDVTDEAAVRSLVDGVVERYGRLDVYFNNAGSAMKATPVSAGHDQRHEDAGMTQQHQNAAPKVWRGRFFEDFDVGDVYRSRLGRTMTEVDNIWFTTLTMNTNQMHFNTAYAETTRFGRPLMNSCLTLGVICGLSVPDTSENGTANLSWTDIRIPAPVFAGDTLYAESEILSLRESASRPNVGIVGLRTRGINQDGVVVMEFLRTFMCYRRDAPEVTDTFPETTTEWGVG